MRSLLQGSAFADSIKRGEYLIADTMRVSCESRSHRSITRLAIWRRMRPRSWNSPRGRKSLAPRWSLSLSWRLPVIRRAIWWRSTRFWTVRRKRSMTLRLLRRISGRRSLWGMWRDRRKTRRFARRMLLRTYDVFDEARYFQPADNQELYTLRGVKCAISICEDAWNDKQFWERRRYSRDPVEELAQKGAELIISINASPWNIGKRRLREAIFHATTQRFHLPVVYVHMVGGNDQLVFDGSSFAMTAEGKMAAMAKSFDEGLILFDTVTGCGDNHANHLVGDEAAFEALVLGTRDYIRKCGFRSVIVGLSGGIDSSLVATIAVEAVGKENVLGVAMPGPYSSEHSLQDARTLACNLGIRFEVIPIQCGYQAMMQTLAPLFANFPPDTTEENIQSRLRGL